MPHIVVQKTCSTNPWVDNGYYHVYEENATHEVQIGGDMHMYTISALKNTANAVLSQIPTIQGETYKITELILNMLTSDSNVVKETNKYITKETIEQYSDNLHLA